MASSMRATQPYTHGSLPDQSIRLLSILEHAGNPTQFSFHLKTHALADVPAFNALSYVWGQSRETYRVPCQGEAAGQAGVITVTSNLLSALPYLKAASEKPIWIDAVCINQEDPDEKARVVPQMAEYYRKAAEVLIWLGPSSDDSDLAINVLRWMWFPQERQGLERVLCGPDHGQLRTPQLGAIFSALQQDVLITDPAADIRRLGLPPIGHALWPAFAALYRREWFFRVWTYQEGALATHARVLCGDRAIVWPAFQKLGDRLAKTQLMWIGQPSGTFSPLQTMQQEQSLESYLTGMRGMRARQCKFPEDRIFGTLALAPENIRTRINVSYNENDSEHYVNVYRQAAAVFLGSRPELKSDEACALLSFILDQAPSPNKNDSIPSWCPDWRMRKRSAAPCAEFAADATYKALGRWSVDPSDSSTLRVRGLQTDVVDVVLSEYSYAWPSDVRGKNGPADRMLQWLDRCEALTRRTLNASHAAVEEALWKTLLLHSPLGTSEQRTFPANPARGLAAHRKRLAELRESIPRDKTALSAEELGNLGPFLAALGQCMRSKVFFSTQRGTVGVADEDSVANGDVICLFFGARNHFVLHPSSDGTFRFRSAAHVHGMMGDVRKALEERVDYKPPEESAKTFILR
jgi:hypothetical protein